MTKPRIRRRKPAAERRELTGKIPFSGAEQAELRAAAARAGLAFATWARMELLRLARTAS